MENKFKKIPVGKFRMPQKCYICKGTGIDICPYCYGRKVTDGKTCPECKGIGTVKCYACGGRGIVD